MSKIQKLNRNKRKKRSKRKKKTGATKAGGKIVKIKKVGITIKDGGKTKNMDGKENMNTCKEKKNTFNPLSKKF